MFFFLAGLLLSIAALAEESADAWQNTILTEATIKKIQSAKYNYKKCIAEKTQKPDYLNLDSRKATEEIIKECEPELSKMRDIYISDKVPGTVADRHLRQIRIQTTRNLLQELIFAQASRKAD